jgi:hypothetical protein
VRKGIAAALLVLLWSGVAAPTTCTGWNVSPAERKACCQRAQHKDCADQTAADNCCAEQEQARQIGSTTLDAPGQATLLHCTVGAVPPGIHHAPVLHAARPGDTTSRPTHDPPDRLARPLRL